MAHISVATAIEKNKIASGVAFLLLVEVVVRDEAGDLIDTIRLVKNSENYEWQGNLYLASNFDIDITEDIAAEPSLKISAKDHSGYIRERMESYDGGVGQLARVTLVNTGVPDQPAEVQEEFEIMEASHQGVDVSFTLGVDNPLFRRFPPTLQSRNQCRLVFKGPLCKYAGADATCSYSFTGANGCTSKANTINFGGFRGLQDQ